MNPKVLVTGFGPFGEIIDNPSAILARGCGKPSHVLDVSFSAVDRFIEQLDPGSFDSWVMVGVHGTSPVVRLESVAKNWVGSRPDAEGHLGGPGPIDPRLPSQLHGRLWEGILPPEGSEVTCDAGGYLCNYLFFRGLAAFPCKPIGFLHVCTGQNLDIANQARLLDGLLAELTP